MSSENDMSVDEVLKHLEYFIEDATERNDRVTTIPLRVIVEAHKTITKLKIN